MEPEGLREAIAINILACCENNPAAKQHVTAAILAKYSFDELEQLLASALAAKYSVDELSILYDEVENICEGAR